MVVIRIHKFEMLCIGYIRKPGLHIVSKNDSYRLVVRYPRSHMKVSQTAISTGSKFALLRTEMTKVKVKILKICNTLSDGADSLTI